MKKSLTLLLVACIFLTGCNNTDLKNVGKNLEQAKNYNTLITLNIESVINNVDTDYVKIKKVDVDNLNGTAKINSNTNINNEEKEETYYMKTENENVVTYKEVNGIIETKEVLKDHNSLYYITAFINENSEVLQEEKESNEITFTIKLPKDRVNAFLESYYDSSQFDLEDYKVTGDAILKVTVTNEGTIKTLSADFMDSIKYTNKKSDLKKFNLTIEYSNFNKAKEVKIPKKLLEPNTDTNLEKTRQYVNDYILEINNLKLDNGKTNNKLGYSITSADLTIVENKVESGIVKLDGYTVEIKDNKVGIPFK